MSIQLANGEKILRSYDYAQSQSKGLAGTDGSKTLVITNKRIIHKETIKGKKQSGTNMSEMPVKAAKYVRTSFKETRYPILLVIGIILAIAAVFCLIGSFSSGSSSRDDNYSNNSAYSSNYSSSSNNYGSYSSNYGSSSNNYGSSSNNNAKSSNDANVPLIFFFIFGVIAAVFIVIYALKKTYAFSCSIDTDTHITKAFDFSSISGDSRTSGIFAAFRKANNSFYIKVKVNSEVAQQMADELGYVIAAAANGDFDQIAAE